MPNTQPYITSNSRDTYVLLDPSRGWGEQTLRAVIINWADAIEVRPRKDTALTPDEETMITRFCDELKEGKRQ